MPISREEFESAELDPSFVVEEFLRSSSGYAYTRDELIVQLASKKMALTADEMQDILGTLAGEEKLIEKIVRDTVYYIYRKPLELRRS